MTSAIRGKEVHKILDNFADGCELFMKRGVFF